MMLRNRRGGSIDHKGCLQLQQPGPQPWPDCPRLGSRRHAVQADASISFGATFSFWNATALPRRMVASWLRKDLDRPRRERYTGGSLSCTRNANSSHNV